MSFYLSRRKVGWKESYYKNKIPLFLIKRSVIRSTFFNQIIITNSASKSPTFHPSLFINQTLVLPENSFLARKVFFVPLISRKSSFSPNVFFSFEFHEEASFLFSNFLRNIIPQFFEEPNNPLSLQIFVVEVKARELTNQIISKTPQ